MAAKILIVEDDAVITELLRYNLAAAGYEIACTETAEDARLLIEEQGFDLIVLDWMLPEMSGIELCGLLQRSSKHSKPPILMLTARGEESDRIRGLTTGADDYVIKPFSVPELLARVKALLRRASPERVSDLLSYRDISLDRTAHRVTRGAREVSLGPTEFRMLEALLENTGRVLTRGKLLDRVWGNAVDIDERTVDVHIGRLRKALIRGDEPDPIRTVRGSGYLLSDLS